MTSAKSSPKKHAGKSSNLMDIGGRFLKFCDACDTAQVKDKMKVWVNNQMKVNAMKTIKTRTGREHKVIKATGQLFKDLRMNLPKGNQGVYYKLKDQQ